MSIYISLIVMTIWIACAAVLISIGSLILRWLTRNYTLTEAFWIGFVPVVGILQIWQLFHAVELSVDLIFVAIGAIGFLFNWSRLKDLFSGIAKTGFWPILIYIVLIWSLALRATGPCDHFDTGLYGATAVRWILSYPIIPGLANLHGRLGFNSNVFLCIAALDQGVLRNLGHHLFLGLLVSGFWATIWPAIVRAYSSPSASAADWFNTILLIPGIYWTTRGHLVGTMTDVPATIACLVATGFVFRRLDKAGVNHDPQRDSIGTYVAMLLLSLSVTFKLSVAAFALLLWIIALGLTWNSSGKQRSRVITSSIALSTLLMVPWLIRNVLLSGYPLYPKPFFGANVDWKVSPLECKWMLGWIRSWARVPGGTLDDTQGFHWLRSWLHTNILNREGLQVPLFLTIVAVVGIAIATKRFKSGPWLWLSIPAAVGVGCWFAQGPALRFGEAAIWMLAGCLTTMTILAVTEHFTDLRVQRIICLGLILVGCYCIAPHHLWKEVYRPLLTSRAPLELPRACVVPEPTKFGLVVFRRETGSQCWDAALPCTPYFNDTLRLRRPGEMQSGFNSDWPTNLSEIANQWIHKECSQNDLKCSTQRTSCDDPDHGSE